MLKVETTQSGLIYFTWLILAFFISIIIIGWTYLLEPAVGTVVVSTILAILIAIVAFFAARHIAEQRARLSISGSSLPYFTGWKSYLLLFFISAIGTLNAAFVILESRSILRSDISLVRSRYNTLLAKAQSSLPPPGYMAKQESLDSLLKSLREEIVNPNKGNFCGFGSAAQTIHRKISELIPQFPIIRGSGPIRPCDSRAEKLYESYESIAREMLRKDKQFANSRGSERLDFKDDLQRHHKKHSNELLSLENAAAGYGGTGTLPVQYLLDARQQYNSDRTKYSTFVVDSDSSIGEIAVLQTDRTGYAATLELIFRRLGHLTTWVYFLFAVGLDFALIYFLSRVFVGIQHTNNFASHSEENFPQRFTIDPEFLWIRPTQLSR